MISSYQQKDYEACFAIIPILEKYEGEEWFCKYYQGCIEANRQEWGKAENTLSEAKEKYKSEYTRFEEELKYNSWKIWIPWNFIVSNPYHSNNPLNELKWVPIYRRFLLRRGYYALSETIDLSIDRVMFLLMIIMMILAPFAIILFGLITLIFGGIGKAIKALIFRKAAN